MNANLKKTLITTVLAFTAGVACAGSIAAFSYEDTLSPEEFLERSTVLLEQVADIGAHVAGTRDGRTFLRSAPPIACTPPPNPKRPEGTVPIAQLRAGRHADALAVLRELRNQQTNKESSPIEAGLALDLLGEAQLRAGDADAARAAHEAARSAFARQLSDEHPYLIRNATLSDSVLHTRERS